MPARMQRQTNLVPISREGGSLSPMLMQRQMQPARTQETAKQIKDDLYHYDRHDGPENNPDNRSNERGQELREVRQQQLDQRPYRDDDHDHDAELF
jgi:hypothetical protein